MCFVLIKVISGGCSKLGIRINYELYCLLGETLRSLSETFSFLMLFASGASATAVELSVRNAKFEIRANYEL